VSIPTDRDPTSNTRILVLRNKPDATLGTKRSRSRLPRMGSVTSVYLTRLYEVPQTATSLAEAIAFIESFNESKPGTPYTRYEVGVRYSNGNEVRAQFMDKATGIAFLRGMR